MILLDIMDKKDINWYFEYNITSRKRLIDNQNTNVILIYKTDISEIKPEEQLRFTTQWIKLIEYKNYTELLKIAKQEITKQKTIKQKEDIKIIINTFYEKYINISNKLKHDLNQKTSNNPEIFLNKYMQRNKIWKTYPETVAQCILLNKDQIKNNKKIKNTLKKIQFPVFIKPTGGFTSIGTAKVENEEELNIHLSKINKIFKKLDKEWFKQEWILVEEYIKWDLYAMTYFVDENQKIYVNKVMKQRDNFGWPHTHLICGEVSEDANIDIDIQEIKKLAKKTVISWNIRNTFICHQFKKTPKQEYKTIELNWRIGGFNVELYWLTYNMNFFSIFSNQEYKTSDKQGWYSAFFRFYPKDKQKFNWYDMSIFNKINALKSKQRFYLLKIPEQSEIWAPNDGFEYYGTAVLYNIDKKQFQEDFKFIKNNYYNIFFPEI